MEKKQEDEQYLEKRDSSVHHTKRGMSVNRFCTFFEDLRTYREHAAAKWRGIFLRLWLGTRQQLLVGFLL